MPMIWSTVLLSGCVKTPAGDFCDVAFPLTFHSQEVVSYLSANDPSHLRGDIAHNEYGKANCPKGWQAKAP